MMRMESKHKFFTDHARKIHNYVNITKSLAIKHQQTMLNYNSNYNDDIEASSIQKKLCSLELISKMAMYNNFNDNVYTVNYLKYNGIEYRIGFILAENNQFFQITNIISNGKKNTFSLARFFVHRDTFVI